ncbi:hypothetical protein [Mycolicibacterium sp. HS_4_1]
MSTTTTELHDLINGLRRCTSALTTKYGDDAATRRIINDTDSLLNDVERLDIDTDELESGQKQPGPAPEKIAITDAPVEPTLWRGIDDEGLGGSH